MNYRKANIISNISMVLGLAVALLLCFFSESSYEFRLMSAIIVIAIIVAGGIIRIAFCRCPNCGKVLYSRNYFLPKYCSRCGEEL